LAMLYVILVAAIVIFWSVNSDEPKNNNSGN